MSPSAKRKIFWSLLLAAVCGGLWLGVGYALAQTTPDLGLAQVGEGIGLPATDIRLIVARIIRAALGLLGIVALGLALYAGFTWMTAGGNEDKIATAKKIMFNAVIGLIIILTSFAIVSFVISKLLYATGGLPEHCYNGTIDAGEAGVDCGGECPSCGGGTSPYGASNVFYVKQKPDGFTCIRNYYPMVVFNHPVNLATLDNNIIIRRKDNLELAAGTWQFASETAQNIVKFAPQGDCGTPPNDCLAASTTYELVFQNTSDIKSQENLTLNCNLDAKCTTAEFTTGESVDRQPPTVEINNPVDDSHLEKGINYPVSITYWDDNGVQNVSLFDNEYFIDSVQVTGCQKTGTVIVNWPTAGATMATHTLETTVFDWAAATGTHGITVWLDPAHCFNDIQDITADPATSETGIDCGGECGACGGADCDNNGDCASGWCEIPPGICSNRMKITNIDPMDGAASTTYVTISGRYFGDNGGHVYFTKSGGGWTEAPIVTCGSGIDNWTQSQLVVSVPGNAVDGPIKVETVATPAHASFVDVTDGSDDWGGVFPPFDVNNQQRPGLCNVQPKSGPPYVTTVSLSGINFGAVENKVMFGTGSGAFNALIKNWSNEFINVKVPGMAPGTVGIKVMATLGGSEVESNGMAFSVTEETTSDTPVIHGITPNQGAKGQYITITGKNFGDGKGKVYFKLDGDESGILGDFNFPDACGNDFWKDTQIIVKFPQSATEVPGKYSVQVQRSSDNAISPIGAFFQAETGAPGPGICKMDPISGPVPFATGNFMELIGEHLIGAQPYFWRDGASSSTISSRAPATVESWSENNILSIPPEIAKSGPVVAYRASDSKMSNSINFTVYNCLENNNSCTQTENKCCLKGADAGMCIPKNDMCEGETRSTGYMWRFGTRDLPVVPRVVERCNNETDLGLNIPSPSPSVIWNVEGETDHINVCRTALVTVAFNTAIDQDTINSGNVQIFKCVSSTINKNFCSHDGTNIALDTDSYTLHNDVSELADNFYLTMKPDTVGGAWSDNTWYQVILKSEIQAEAAAAGNLMASRPCGAGTAYCFIFKTDAQDCKLKDVVVTPLDYWTGVLESPILYRKVKDNADESGPPLEYRGNGLSDQKCVWMNMDSYSWLWGVSSASYAEIFSAEQNEAQVSALANTVAIGLADDAVKILATASKTGDTKIGDSPLHIDLSQPKVLDYWPKCLSACTNAEIGAKFNTIMANYNLAAVKLYRCLDENCYGKINITDTINPSFKISDRRYLEMPLIIGELDKNTIYQVVLSVSGTSTLDGVNQLWSGASTTNDGIKSKPYQQEFTWRFRTKQEKCQPSKVNVLPLSYVVKSITAKVVYSAETFSSPDACNANGQKLNSWSFNWNWTSSIPAVAKVPSPPFVTKGHNNLCTAKCLKKGSDILLGAPLIESVCGNGIIEAGEDCDVPNKLNGCGLNCLHLGNASSTCGNGILENNFGEDCDKNLTVQGCSANCLYTGSNQSTGAEEIGASICGNGQIGLGEECDIGVAGNRLSATSSMNCSGNCLHAGTPLSAEWCFNNVTAYGGFELSEFTDACKKTISQCGDGVVSPSEECDPGSTASSTCSTACLQLSNCNPVTTEGCTAEGQLAGSSLMYTIPSVCGDTLQGYGEATGCEQGFVVSHTFVDPWVLAIGVGNGPTSGEPPTQQTTITGQATAYSVSGDGKFIIPCGYHSDSECNAGLISGPLGVAQNSCCYARPQIVSAYPAMAPLPVNVCPNTYIEIKFNKRIDPATLYGNLILAKGRIGTSCLAGEENVTPAVVSVVTATDSDIWYKKIWKQIIRFVKDLFKSNTASAFKTTLNSVSWCAGSESIATEVIYEPSVSADSNEVTSTVKVILKKSLATSTDYAVILGPGIKDSRGVSVGVLSGSLNHNWKFITGEEICTLTGLSVNPSAHLFQKAGNAVNLEAIPGSISGQEIQPVDGYRWEYVWEPMENDYVTLEVTTSTPNEITAKNRNGEIDVVVESKFTENIFTETNPILRGSSHITIFLCENPWPSVSELPWRDADWDFSTYYCRDSGSTGVADDLPNLSATMNESSKAPYKRRYLMTDKDYADAIGIMIFTNPDHLSVQDWYQANGFKGNLTSLSIDGYSAMTDGNNYYVDALNISSAGDIYTNIYLFSINNNAGQEMKNVFQQLITNLKFNNDFLNEKYCGQEFISDSINYDMPCQNDLDCWNLNPSGPDQLCLNQKDKLQRNYQRLKDVRTMTDVLQNYNQNQQIINSSTLGFYPLMKDNTYLSGQALSVWPAAWTSLSGELGTSIPADPVNKLGAAGTCFQKNELSQYTACTKDVDCATPVIDEMVSQWLSDKTPADQKGISDAQLEGDVSYSAGKGHGDAFDIAGDSVSKILIPHKENYNSDSFTISTWIYPRKKNTAVLFQKGGLDSSGASVGGWGLEYSGWGYEGSGLTKVFNNGTVRFAIYPPASSDYKYVSVDSAAPLALNQWHHLVAIYNGEVSGSKNLSLYIDGLPVGANTVGPDVEWVMRKEDKAGAVSLTENAELQNNALNIEAGQNFNGLIDNTAFYSGALNGKDVADLYEGICIIHDSLTGWSVEDRRFSFSCNPLSYAYRYIYDNGEHYFNLRLNIEEDGINPSNWPAFISEFGGGTGSGVVMDGVCQADDEVASPYSTVCGDGVLGGNGESTEECDPPGKINYDISTCPDYALKSTCNSSCRWNTAVNVSCAVATGAQCGDGKIQAVTGEVCDDGDLNGTNGRCNEICTGIVNNCGNYWVDEDELCDPTFGRQVGEIKKTGWCIGGAYMEDVFTPCNYTKDCPDTLRCNARPDDRYSLIQNNSCNWDCKSRGPYCGDGVVQTAWAENCENDESCSTMGVAGSKKCSDKCRYDNSEVEGMIGYWPFDRLEGDTTGYTPNEVAARSSEWGSCIRSGTNANCPAISKGRNGVNGSFYFGGKQYIQIKNYSSSPLTKIYLPQFTVETWIKPITGNPYNARVYEEGPFNSEEGGYGLEFRPYYGVAIDSFRCKVGEAGGAIYYTDSNPVSINEWHHVVCTFNGATYGTGEVKGILSIYVDGVLQSATTTAVMGVTKYPLCFGNKCVASGSTYIKYASNYNSFRGYIDNPAHYSRALPLEEIQEHYNTTNGWYCTAGGEIAEDSTCGNGVVEEMEACDMGTQNGVACSPVYPYPNCTYCSADCASVITVDFIDNCGNGIWNYADGEICDPTNSATDYVRNYSLYSSDRCGICKADCTYTIPPIYNVPTGPCVAHGLGWCGDNLKNGWESCDGTDLGGLYPACSEGGYGGNLKCLSNCTDVYCDHDYCGDGDKNGPEVCDGSDFGGELTFVCPEVDGFEGYYECADDCMSKECTYPSSMLSL